MLALAATAACGKAGPPLPPLVRVPSAPAELVAERRGASVDVHFVVPSTNSDGSRPADEDHVDLYAITTADAVTGDHIIGRGTRVARIQVKAPRDPDKTVEAGDSDADVEPPSGPGLDQGTTARVTESLNAAAFKPAERSRDDDADRRRRAHAESGGPLLGAAASSPSRTYVAVGFSTRGRKGQPSKPVTVPLLPAPPAPEPPLIAYNETAVTVTWSPVRLSGMVQEPDRSDVLPSTAIGIPVPTVAYHVYDASAEDASAEVRVTTAPAAQTTFTDSRMALGARRCYRVRAVETINNMTIEGDASAVSCKTLVDTFPPAAPKNVQAVANERMISLIWDPNPEKDLAGYLVFRTEDGNQPAQQITPEPIVEARFNDPVPQGTRYGYVVKAVDKAGNPSAPSAPAYATAR